MKLKTISAWIGLLLCVRLGAPSTVADDDDVHNTAAPGEHNPASSGSGQIDVRMNEWQRSIYRKIKYWELVISLFIGSAAVVANIVILTVMKKYKSFAVPHVYMIALAFCDMNIGSLTTWRSVADWLSCRPQWLRSVCRWTYWPSVGLDAGYSSSAGLIAMFLSIDRCIALKYPFKYTRLRTVRSAICLSVAICVVDILLCINYPMRLMVQENIANDYSLVLFHKLTDFGLNGVAKRSFSSIGFLTRFGIPLTMMAISNTWTLLIIRQINKNRQELEAETKMNPNTKCLTLTVGVVVIFFVTQLPRAGYLVDSMIYFNAHRTLFEYEVFILLGNLFSKVNSLANIFIYFILSEEFRKVFLSLFGCTQKDSGIEQVKKMVCDASQSPKESPEPKEQESSSQRASHSTKTTDDEAIQI